MPPSAFLAEIEIVDSHTGGEPTRVVLAGGPDLGTGSLAARRERLQRQHDDFRTRVINEPRGSDVLVGALLCVPVDPQASVGVIFFNNAGVLGMCGHGTIGLMVTLYHLGRIAAGVHRIETPVGLVTATIHDAHRVTVENVASYCWQRDVPVEVPGYGTFRGDIAYGGNWFFLVREHTERIVLDNVARLSLVSCAIMQALQTQGITGRQEARIDHVEFFAEEDPQIADSRNFVMCPGGAFDRSPCGTGTSAKVACLADDGKLQPGQIWRQAGICGSVFEATYRRNPQQQILPSITGTAYICGRGHLVVEPGDPFADGIRR